ncbi:DUF309 domain-containing protein [Neobacillus vireti]|uniref:DUF309 domain-containing protein n=1 Tax=Neobacillus vireti TaxID=220686 RepID=UPI002FFDD50C
MYPKEYIEFLAHFNGDRDYFECHEILEEFWKDSNEREKDSIWVGLILLAVSRYHHRRGNFIGANRTLEKAITILSLKAGHQGNLGLDLGILFPLLSKLLTQIQKEERYQSINLPVSDHILLKACLKKCNELEIIWEQNSNLEDEYIVHKHKLRDRSPVIVERMKALKNKGSG